jgi:hypothetical protein
MVFHPRRFYPALRDVPHPPDGLPVAPEITAFASMLARLKRGPGKSANSRPNDIAALIKTLNDAFRSKLMH